MSKIKESLEANKDMILEALPKEFHAGFLNELTMLPTEVAQPITGDAEIEAIKAELIANPAVDENAAAAELTEIKATELVVAATEAEIEADKAVLLKEATAQAAETAKNIDAA